MYCSSRYAANSCRDIAPPPTHTQLMAIVAPFIKESDTRGLAKLCDVQLLTCMYILLLTTYSVTLQPPNACMTIAICISSTCPRKCSAKHSPYPPCPKPPCP